MEFINAGNARIYATGRILSNILKGPQNIFANFGQQPNLIEHIFPFTFIKTYLPTLKPLEILFLYG
jgi:hypothetical protein